MDSIQRKEKIEELKILYLEKGRHSQYQLLASDLRDIVEGCEPPKSKYEIERLEYVKKNLELKDKAVLDIGGNTGYFTFEACKLGAKCVDYFEGNKTHADFVKLAAEVLKVEDKVKIYNEYYLADKKEKMYDVVFFLNVLHHLGYDYFLDGEGIRELDMEKAKYEMILYLNNMAAISRYMVFQMGFNWGGDIKNCLFAHGTKAEMEDFMQKGTERYWDIKKIGVPVKTEGGIVYEDMCPENNQRNDAMGEFLNRPLFLMKSKMFS